MLVSRYTFDRFVVGSSNQRAHAACMEVVASFRDERKPLFAYGGVGVGKTHLVQALGHEILAGHADCRIACFAMAEFADEFIAALRRDAILDFRRRFADLEVLILDDAQVVTGRQQTQRELGRVLNLLQGRGCQLILAADRPPVETFGLWSLCRRFERGHLVEIQRPDPTTCLAVVKAKAARQGVPLPDSVACFIAGHPWAGVRELEGALTWIEAQAVVAERAITVDLAKESIERVFAPLPAAQPPLAEAGRPPPIGALGPRVQDPPPVGLLGRLLRVPRPARPAPPPPPVRGPEPARPARTRDTPAEAARFAQGIEDLRAFIDDVGGGLIGAPDLKGRDVYVPMTAPDGERYVLRMRFRKYLAQPPSCTFVDARYQSVPAAWPSPSTADGPFRSPDFICTPPTAEFYRCHPDRAYRYGDGSLVDTIGTIFAALRTHRGGRWGRRTCHGW